MKKHFEPYKKNNLILRLIEVSDIAHTLKWRNHDDHRTWFATSDVIMYADHQKWFFEYLKDENDFIFIITDDTSNLIGQLSIYHIDWENKTGVFGRFLVNPDYENRGYMRMATSLAIDFAKNVFGLKQLKLEVKPNNVKAISIYQKNGFIKQCEDENSGMLIMTLSL